MFIKNISYVLPGKKMTVGREALSSKEHFEDETKASYYVAGPLDTPSSLAIKAVGSAIRRAGVKKNGCQMVVYAQSLLKDHQAWSLSASICDSLHLKNASFLDIYQGCNGGICALELIDKISPFHKKGDFAIMATSTLLPRTMGDHLTLEKGGFLSDGAAALVLSGDTGQYEILSTDMKYDPSCNEFIKLPYGGTEFAKKGERVGRWDLIGTKEAFTKDSGEEKIFENFLKIRTDSTLSALKKARAGVKDISFVVVPNYCRLYNRDIISLFKHLGPGDLSTDAGMEISHVGAADIFINLARMDGKIKKRSLVAVMQDGAGISSGCAILRKC